MKHEDKPIFAAMMASLGEYYGRDVSDSLIGMYWQGLQHYDITAVRDAMNRHVANPDTGQFWPKIADIAKMLGGSTQDAALIAWAKVDKAVRVVGTYCDVAFDDPLIHRVLADMGGWIALGTRSEEDWPFVAKEFENRYRGYKIRGERPEYPPVLTGITNASNARHGHSLEATRLIGHADTARRVITNGTYSNGIGITVASDVANRLRLVSDAGEGVA